VTANALLIPVYVFAAFAAASISARFSRTAQMQQALVWAASACLLATLATLKLLDAGPAIVGKIREFAKADGWYQDHRSAQYLAMAGLIFVAIIALARAWSRRSRLDSSSFLAALSSLLLLVWVAARASSLHVADEYMGLRMGPITISQAGELSLLLAVILCALNIRKQRES
jgi:hypothetical protein